MNIEDQMMLKVIEHEELKALDAFGELYKIVEDFKRSDHNNSEYSCAEEELIKARTTLIFWMRERAKFNPYATCA